MSKDFNEVLDKAIMDEEADHIRLMITTNGTKFTNTIMNKLEYFEGLDLNVSVDGTGEVYDYIRWPFSWDMWCQRFETLLQWVDDKKFYKRDFRLRTSTLVSAYNWLDAPRLYEHLYDYTNKYPWLNDINYVPRIDFNLFLRPEDSELSPRWLPDHLLDLGLERWEQTSSRQVDEFRAFVEQHRGKQIEERQEKFVYMTTSLDEQREESYWKLDAELAQWIEEFNGRK